MTRALNPLRVCCNPSSSKDGVDEQPSAVTSALILGQLISVSLAGCGIAAASLSDRGINLPLTLNFFNYALLSFYLLGLRRPLGLPMWRYALYATFDVEANFLVVLSFRYTSITSVMLLDCFAIPSSMLLSAVFLGVRYTSWHFASIGLCLVGLVAMVASDNQKDDPERPYAVFGDLICLVGAFLYACCNVTQESIVKNGHRQEFLGMTGALGAGLSGLQLLAVERVDLAAMAWTPAAAAFVALYAGSLFAVYSFTSVFLQRSDAIVFNLSVLTSDVYAMVFACAVEGAHFNGLFAAAFVFIIGGVVLYHSRPPAVKDAHSGARNGSDGCDDYCCEDAAFASLTNDPDGKDGAGEGSGGEREDGGGSGGGSDNKRGGSGSSSRRLGGRDGGLRGGNSSLRPLQGASGTSALSDEDHA